MPYDAPMSWEEILADPETRRRALAFAGAQPDAVPVPPIGAGTGNQSREPAGTTGTATEPSGLIRRYLEAQGMDARQERLNSLSSGFDNAAETILGGVGVRYARGQPQAPHAAQDVLEAERVRTMAEKAAQPRGASGRPPAMTDEQARAVVRERYPKANEALISNVTAGNFEEVMKDLRAGAGVDERAGAMTRREEMEKTRLEQAREEGKLRRAVDWARLGQQAEENGASRGFRLYIFEREQDAKEQERAAKEAAKAQGQTVPAGEVASVGQSRAAIDALDVLEKQFSTKGASGVGGKLSTFLPWDSDPTKYEDDVLAAAQAVGTVLEGGKLAAGDETKYRNLFPKAGDSLERARNKLANVRRLVSGLTEAKVDALGAAGYNVGGLKPGGAAKPVQAPPIAPGAKIGGGGKIKVRNKETGQSLWFDSKTAYQLLSKPDKFERGE